MELHRDGLESIRQAPGTTGELPLNMAHCVMREQDEPGVPRRLARQPFGRRVGFLGLQLAREETPARTAPGSAWQRIRSSERCTHGLHPAKCRCAGISRPSTTQWASGQRKCSEILDLVFPKYEMMLPTRALPFHLSYLMRQSCLPPDNAGQRGRCESTREEVNHKASRCRQTTIKALDNKL